MQENVIPAQNKTNDCQILYTCKTMLSLPKIRQMIDIQALNQKETSKKPCCPKIAAVWKYIFCGKQVILAANLVGYVLYSLHD
jgi:hypothetical protein